MSRLKEYINLIKKGLPDIDKIAEGLLNSVKKQYNLLSFEEQEEIVRRQLICHQCPFYSLNTINNDEEYKKLYNKSFKTERVGEKFCVICGCPDVTKTASLSSECGLATYNEEFPNNPQPLKWEKFNKQ